MKIFVSGGTGAIGRPRRPPKRYAGHSRRAQIPNRTSIDKRPQIVAECKNGNSKLGGKALVIIAYFRPIHHLIVERCARREFLLCVVQSVNIAAIPITIVLVRSSNRVWPFQLTLH
jgi:hypothetical protein